MPKKIKSRRTTAKAKAKKTARRTVRHTTRPRRTTTPVPSQVTTTVTTTVTTPAPVHASPTRQTLVSFILDETGSMQSVKDRTISGFNEYIQTLRNKGGNVLFTLTKFNSAKTEIVHTGTPIAAVNELTPYSYQPNHGTPLYDAIGRTIAALDRDVIGRRDNPAVLVVIMTDGEENSSQEFNLPKVNELIKSREARGWDFVYLGANHNAWQSAQSLGMSFGNTAQYDQGNTRSVLCAAASATLRYATSNALGGASASPRAALFNVGERTIIESKTVIDKVDIDSLTQDATAGVVGVPDPTVSTK
jgi:hypothetical protein